MGNPHTLRWIDDCMHRVPPHPDTHPLWCFCRNAAIAAHAPESGSFFQLAGFRPCSIHAHPINDDAKIVTSMELGFTGIMSLMDTLKARFSIRFLDPYLFYRIYWCIVITLHPEF
ncbi:hypothetical protein KC19_2G165200 [Ceratodon purpureus]|uniref:Uncharacterized protein n=1 Tax=Ceratodon purpureus TaxID=3225 RepID=A0A8T0IW74_CERPU|nr:hypothetical protein KC19_2G165200 [Ceratodon purpureus]